MAEVQKNVREIRRRTASFKIDADGRPLTGKVNAKEVAIGTGSGYNTIYLPKTIEAINALSDLVDAIRAEMLEQGVMPKPEEGK